jgi:hypothetical protein
LAETPGLRLEKLQQKLVEKFGIHVSTSWVSRLCQRYEIAYKNPKPPRVKKVRVPKPPKPPKPPKLPKQPKPPKQRPPPPPERYTNFIVTTPQYPLPPYRPEYPDFRQDLDQAITATPFVAPSFVAPPIVARPAIPPLVVAPRDGDEESPSSIFGMLKPSNWPLKPAQPTLSTPRPALTTQYSHPPEYQYPPNAYPSQQGHPPTTQTPSDVPTQPLETPGPQTQPSSSTGAKSTDVVWEVLKVVECG